MKNANACRTGQYQREIRTGFRWQPGPGGIYCLKSVMNRRFYDCRLIHAEQKHSRALAT